MFPFFFALITNMFAQFHIPFLPMFLSISIASVAIICWKVKWKIQRCDKIAWRVHLIVISFSVREFTSLGAKSQIWLNCKDFRLHILTKETETRSLFCDWFFTSILCRAMIMLTTLNRISTKINWMILRERQADLPLSCWFLLVESINFVSYQTNKIEMFTQQLMCFCARRFRISKERLFIQSIFSQTKNLPLPGRSKYAHTTHACMFDVFFDFSNISNKFRIK